MIPKSQEAWEALSEGQFKEFSDKQLKDALQEYFGLRSQVYFMPVPKKVAYIMNPALRPALQAEAEERQRMHQSAGAVHRGKKPVKELIAERSEDREYRFIGIERPDSGFTDPFSDRRGRIAYLIQDTADGAEFHVQKQTCKALQELGRLADFDDRAVAKKQKPAHKAGFQTIEDVIAGGDPEVAEAAQAVKVPVSTASDRETELDDILNSIPQ